AHPFKHTFVLLIHEVPVSAVAMRGIKRVIPEHVLRLFRNISARDMKDVLVMPKREVNVVEAAIRLVNATFCLVTANFAVGVSRKKFRENDLLGVRAANRESIAHHGPLWLTVKTKDFPEVVQEARQDEPTRMAVLPDCFRGLKEMLDLSQGGRRNDFVNQSIQILSHLPDAFLAAIQAAIFRFLVDDKIECLAGMILAIEL